MDENFILYTDRLLHGHEEDIFIEVPCDFLEVTEKELSFRNKVKVFGKGYVAESHLVIHVDVQAQYALPCSLCNKEITKTLNLEGQYFTIPLDEIKSKKYDFKGDIRSAILLETPLFSSCEDPNCPEKEQINRFLRKEESSSNFPFADLES